MDNIINHPLVLIIFSISVITMLVIDLGVFNKKSHIVTNKEAKGKAGTIVTILEGTKSEHIIPFLQKIPLRER